MMKRLFHAALFLVIATGLFSGFGILAILALTDDLSPPIQPAIALISPIGEQERDDEFDVDRLRELCRVEWPKSVAGERSEEARRKACRAVPQ